jgi:hypothetical protein
MRFGFGISRAGQVASFIIGIAALFLLLPTSALGQAGGSQNTVPADATTSLITQFIYTRQCEVRLHVEPGEPAVIPFAYPSRPTITVDLCGSQLDLLFDTGALSCLLQPATGQALPSQLRYSPAPWALAPLEAKQAVGEDGGVQLNYALAPMLSCQGQLYIRDVPLRVYPTSPNADRDYAGAFAAILLADYLVVVNNSERQLEIYDKQTWQPPPGSVMLPLLLLPRGYFVPAWVGGEQYWFHFDTGFSGEIGFTSGLLRATDVSLTEVGGSEVFSGWHSEQEFAEYNFGAPIELRPYPASPWNQAAPLQLDDLTVLDYGDAYEELTVQGYKIGGIMGSGLWQRYDYALDLRQQRIYISAESTE